MAKDKKATGDMSKKEKARQLNEPPRLTVLEEVGNAVTHGVGALMSVAGLVLLLLFRMRNRTKKKGDLFLIYMALVTLNKDIKRVFQYHGAEHKTIFCYEHGLDMTVENVRIQSRFHPRCGTSFIVLMLIVGILIGLFIPFTNVWLRTATKILLLPLTVGLGYELIRICGRYDNIVTRIIAAPGIWMQHLTTKEPKDEMIEVAIAAMKDVIPANGEDIIR